MKSEAIKCVEIAHDEIIKCPFCNHVVLDPNKDKIDEEYYSPCGHTIFVAHDMGFDYVTTALEKNLGIANMQNEDIDTGDGGFDGLTSRTTIPGSVRFASYVPAPSFFGTYVGFAPAD